MHSIGDLYYMASSVSGQDESNPALWLATCPLGITHRVPQEKFPREPYNKFFIDQACSVKMAGYWPRPFFASLWTSTPSQSINTQKKNLANIQPSWPHTWSITHNMDPYPNPPPNPSSVQWSPIKFNVVSNRPEKSGRIEGFFLIRNWLTNTKWP